MHRLIAKPSRLVYRIGPFDSSSRLHFMEHRMQCCIPLVILSYLFVAAGCSSSSTSGDSSSPGSNTVTQSQYKKSGGNDPNPAVQGKKVNPLVGKGMAKKGNEH